jgi:ParB-like chromosome segregation protein Spo0J
MTDKLEPSGITWHNERRILSELSEHPKNPRITNKRGYAALEKSILRNGYFDPIVINLDGTVLSGHRRRTVLMNHGVTEEDVRVPDRMLTDEEAEPILIEANKAIAGEFDLEILTSEFELAELEEWGFDKLELGIPEFAPSTAEVQGKLDEIGKDVKCPNCGHEFKA